MKCIRYKSRVAYSSNNIFSYLHTLLNFKLIVTTQEKDPRVAVESSLKTSVQCAETGKKANGVLRCRNTMRERHAKSTSVTIEITGSKIPYYSNTITLIRYMKNAEEIKALDVGEGVNMKAN